VRHPSVVMGIVLKLENFENSATGFTKACVCVIHEEFHRSMLDWVEIP